jgi:menaquinol-cytochrome c reductase iron-sulfur subunit
VTFAAACLGLLLVVVPFAAGFLVLIDPLRRKGASGQFLRVAPLDAVPDDGRPRQFPVVVERRDDAWNRYRDVPVGAVWLRRTAGGDTVEAFNVICPHLGCSIGYAADRNEFACPCHTSAFALDGQTLSGPSPRGMDTLECRIDEQNGRREVWVKFENFYTGRADKVAKV